MISSLIDFLIASAAVLTIGGIVTLIMWILEENGE